MKTGDGEGRRFVRALRAVPGALREDLWTGAAEPLPAGARRPRWQDWWPAFMPPLVLIGFLLWIGLQREYGYGYGLGSNAGVLLGGVQAAAVVVAVFRPLQAWWASTAVVTAAAWAANTAWATHVDVRIDAMVPWTGNGLLAQAWVLFLVALRCRPRAAFEALAISLVMPLLRDPFGGLSRYDDLRFGVLALTMTTVFGTLVRGRRVARTQLVVQEELTAEERSRRTQLEERNRIARELHDVVAHHMSVISIQAQVTPHLVDNPSDALRENVAGIRENAVEALAELRRVLGVLRSEDAVPDGVRHAPQPTLDQLGELIENVRAAGLTVTEGTAGERRPLPPGVELSAYRIVQEALSNAMRHAPGAEVRVETGYGATGLTVRVTNSAPEQAASPSPGAGHGLLGMRERTAMLGGELAVGPTPEGGWEVTAFLPASASAASAASPAPLEDIR
ncbi:sensor histidine kinase [Streptomyces morookaense]|uniref:sensor histidine kinase n=1 Tax=Streptomyces morookaense TaxID=1970 RepID=UPI0033EAB92E